MKKSFSEKEIYPKENNILQLSLFNFSKEKLKKTVSEWIDEKNNKCRLGRVPIQKQHD